MVHADARIDDILLAHNFEKFQPQLGMRTVRVNMAAHLERGARPKRHLLNPQANEVRLQFLEVVPLAGRHVLQAALLVRRKDFGETPQFSRCMIRVNVHERALFGHL